METFSVGYALLSMQSALSDVITPELRAVIVNICPKTEVFFMYFYYDGKASEKMIDLWQCACTEASAHLGPDCFVEETIERLDFPKKIPCCGTYAYLRKESPPLPPGSTVYPVSKKIVQFDKPVGFFASPIDGQKHKTNLGIVQEESIIIPVKPTYYKIPITPAAYALLSMQRALLGRVVPSLRLVTVDLPEKGKTLHIRFCYEGQASPEMIYLWELTVADVYADCGPDYVLEYEIVRVDIPEKMPWRGRLAYERQEEVPQSLRFISFPEH